MKQLDELYAAGRIRSLEEVRAELAERQAEVDAKLGRLLERVSLKENLQLINRLNEILIDRAF